MLRVVKDVTVTIADAEGGRRLIDQICAVYDEVFSAPPFFWRADESDLHRGRLAGLLEDPTFGLAIACQGEKLVGFAYGFMVPAGTQRWARLSEPVDAETAREWPGRTFLLFDYAVLAEQRGQGIGRALHDTLLRSRTRRGPH